MYHHFYKHKITILNIHIDPNAAKLSNADAGANAFADDAAKASCTHSSLPTVVTDSHIQHQ